MKMRAFRELGQPASHKRKHAYKIGEHIGSGEFGEVKLAESIETGELVAIKIVPKSSYSSLVSQSKRLNSYGTLEHPNVLHLIEWFESRDKYYFVLQYMAGGELYDVVESRGHLPEDEARVLTQQLLSAIKYLHENNTVHRDLKLENILTDENHSHVVVADLGLAVHVDSDDELLHARCGSLGYTAPEVYSPNRPGYGKPVDMWSLGVITFIMLGGRFPFVGSTPVEVAEEGLARRIRFTNSPPWTEVSEEAKDFIRKVLEPDPQKRLTAAQALEHPWIKMPPKTKIIHDDEKGSSEHIETKNATSAHATGSRKTYTHSQGSSSYSKSKGRSSDDDLTLRRTITDRGDLKKHPV